MSTHTSLFPRLTPALGVAAALCLAVPASAQLLSYDGFDNGPLADLHASNGGTGWLSSWSDAGNDPTAVLAGGLQFAGLATASGAAGTPYAGGLAAGSLYQRTFQSVPVGTTTLYVSFLLRPDAAATWGGLAFGQYPYQMQVGVPLGYDSYGLMTSQGLGDLSTRLAVAGETTLVVVRIALNTPAAGSSYRLYLDPPIGSLEPVNADAIFGLGPVSALPTSVSLRNGTGVTTDEVRVGLSWASVLPAAPPVWTDMGFGKPGIAGAPHLTGTGPMTPASTNTLNLADACPLASCVVGIGVNVYNLPYLGGVLVPYPLLVLPLSTDAAGTSHWQLLLPSGLPAGIPLLFQYWIEDSAATFGWSASNGLRGVTR